MEQIAILTKPRKNSSQTPNAQQQLFVGTVVSLSMQLLIVVLVPFLGGHFLDEHYNSAPLWTLVGLALALILAGLATYRGYLTLSNDHKSRTQK